MKMSDLELSLAFKEARKRWGDRAFATYRDISVDGNANCEVGVREPGKLSWPIIGKGSTWAEAFENAK